MNAKKEKEANRLAEMIQVNFSRWMNKEITHKQYLKNQAKLTNKAIEADLYDELVNRGYSL